MAKHSVTVNGNTIRLAVEMALRDVVFAGFEEGREDRLRVLEVVVDHVDEEGLVHQLLNDLARGRGRLVEVAPLSAELVRLVL